MTDLAVPYSRPGGRHPRREATKAGTVPTRFKGNSPIYHQGGLSVLEVPAE